MSTALLACLRRYLVLDLVGWILGLGLGCSVHAWTGRIDAMAAGVIVGENVGFYAAAFLRERRQRCGSRWSALRRLFAEFAAAECLDCGLIRPVALVLATRLSDSPVVGILLGGALADAIYYLVAHRFSATARRTRSLRPSD